MKSNSKLCLPVVALLAMSILWATNPLCVSAQTEDKDRKFIEDTRSSYSLLRRQGLREVRASIFPDWNATLKISEPRQRANVLKLANRLRFSMVANTNGVVQVNHSIIGPKPAKATADALDNLAKGVELSVTGFLMSWAPFMLTDLIPQNLEHYVLQDLESGRMLTFQQQGVDVSVAITRDFEIKELRTAQGVVKPKLMRSKNGFILTGYEGDNENSIVGNVMIKAQIDLAPTQGMLLPRAVTLHGASGQTPIHIEFQLGNYRLKKKI